MKSYHTLHGPFIRAVDTGNDALSYGDFDLNKLAVVTMRDFHRPEYTEVQRQQVVDWMNGKDQPLTNMVPEIKDTYMLSHHLQQQRRSRRRYFKGQIF